MDEELPSSPAENLDITSADLLNIFRLKAVFFPDLGLLGETHESNDERFVRQVGKKTHKVKKWKRVKPLWSGLSGTVWLEELRHSLGSKRVIKEISKQPSLSKPKVDYGAEVLAHCQMSRNKHVFVDFLGWYESSKSINLVTEYLPLGDLERNAPGALPENEARLICSQVTWAIETLHTHGWTHRDLKPKNVYVVRTAPAWWVKVGDFGVSKRQRSSDDRMSTMVGTPNFAAPETIPGLLPGTDNEQSAYTAAIDLWSLGALVFALCTGSVPFPAFPELRSYCWDKTPFPARALSDREISEDGVAFLKGLLNSDPSQRLSAVQALDHSWLASEDDQDALRSKDILPDLNALAQEGKLDPMPQAEVERWDTQSTHFDVMQTSAIGIPDLHRDSSFITETSELFSQDSDNLETSRSSQSSTPHAVSTNHREDNGREVIKPDEYFMDTKESDPRVDPKSPYKSIFTGDSVASKHRKQGSGVYRTEGLHLRRSDTRPTQEEKQEKRLKKRKVHRDNGDDLPKEDLQILEEGEKDAATSIQNSKILGSNLQPNKAAVSNRSRTEQPGPDHLPKKSGVDHKKEKEIARERINERGRVLHSHSSQVQPLGYQLSQLAPDAASSNLRDLEARQRMPYYYNWVRPPRQPLQITAPAGSAEETKDVDQESVKNEQMPRVGEHTSNVHNQSSSLPKYDHRPESYPWPSYNFDPSQHWADRPYAPAQHPHYPAWDAQHWPQPSHFPSAMYPYSNQAFQPPFSKHASSGFQNGQPTECSHCFHGISSSTSNQNSRPTSYIPQREDYGRELAELKELRTIREGLMADLIALQDRGSAQEKKWQQTIVDLEQKYQNIVDMERKKAAETRSVVWQEGRLAGIREAQVVDPPVGLNSLSSPPLSKQTQNNRSQNDVAPAPVVLVDTAGRKMVFPFAKCKTWNKMRNLIEQAFDPFEGVRPWILEERYDLVSDGDKVIPKSVWEDFIEPGASFKLELHPPEYYDEEPEDVEETLNEVVEVSEPPLSKDEPDKADSAATALVTPTEEKDTTALKRRDTAQGIPWGWLIFVLMMSFMLFSSILAVYILEYHW